MIRVKDRSLAARAAADLAWLRRNIPLTTRVARELSKDAISQRVICLNIHLDLKMVPVIEALVAAGSRVLVLGCNPQTTRDEVAAFMAGSGAEVYAWAGMSEAERREGMTWALGQPVEFISEMGGELLAAAVEGDRKQPAALHAGMEATGSGITRLQRLVLPVPVFNWDDLSIKQGLHNRYLVGLMVWHTFTSLTRLTLYDRRVLVVGYGLVGQGIAEYARLLGAHTMVSDLDPVRQLQARHAGCQVVTLAEGLPRADVVITATGRDKVIGERECQSVRDGCLLANAGHSNLEIDVPALRRHPGTQLQPGIEEIDLGGRKVILLAGGAMLNLAAGMGDPYDAFDLTSALMLAGIEFMVRHYTDFPPGIHLLPASVEQRIAGLAAAHPRTPVHESHAVHR